MFTSSTKQIISVLLAVQAFTFVTAQLTQVTDETGSYNVSTKADDYILENRRNYNATLEDFLVKINDLSKSLEDQLTPLDKQKDLLLKSIKEAMERLEPLEVLNAQTEYCVQRYKSELPYADIVSANIESCFTTARGFYPSLVSQLNLHYTNLLTYYNVDFKNALTTCSRTYRNPSTNYTLCITPVISRANAYTNNYRNIFATSLQASGCTLTARMDTAVSCSYTYYTSALISLGAAERLINNCINGVPSGKPCTTLTAGCSNIKYLKVKDTDFTSVNITNPLQGLSKAQGCLELRYTD